MANLSSIEKILGDNEPSGENFEGDVQRLSFEEAQTRKESLIAEYQPYERRIDKPSIIDGEIDSFTYFEIPEDRKETVISQLWQGLRGLASYSVSRFRVSELFIDSNFFSYNGGYTRTEDDEDVLITISDDEIGTLAWVVESLAFMIGLAEEALPPNSDGYFPDDAMSVTSKDEKYLSGLQFTKTTIEQELINVLSPEEYHELQRIFDMIVDRLERQRPSINNKRVSKANLPYFSTPPANYFEENS